jgi:hypothetical protein
VISGSVWTINDDDDDHDERELPAEGDRHTRRSVRRRRRRRRHSALEEDSGGGGVFWLRKAVARAPEIGTPGRAARNDEEQVQGGRRFADREGGPFFRPLQPGPPFVVLLDGRQRLASRHSLVRARTRQSNAPAEGSGGRSVARMDRGLGMPGGRNVGRTGGWEVGSSGGRE